VASGVPQTFASLMDAHTLEGAKQSIVLGPVASQEAIKMLGTNGGGFTTPIRPILLKIPRRSPISFRCCRSLPSGRV
jgi:hypothetical protein